MKGKYIIFKAEEEAEESTPSEVWDNMQLAHTRACTFILAEHYDYSDSPLPEPGYRLREYHRVAGFGDRRFPGTSTHSRVGDWEVTRLEVYPGLGNESSFEAIVICYCHYSPVVTPLGPLPKVQIPEDTNFPSHVESK